jgi:type IV pilus assembly protein PilE
MARGRTMKSCRTAAAFSLIELLIAITIVGVLTAIAVPGYQSYVLQSARTAAGGCLLEYAQFMERVYTTNMTYASNNGDDTELPELQCSIDLAERFSFALDNLDSRSFTLTATVTGAQADDDCESLSYNQAGIKGANGGTGATIVKKCW